MNPLVGEKNGLPLLYRAKAVLYYVLPNGTIEYLTADHNASKPYTSFIGGIVEKEDSIDGKLTNAVFFNRGTAELKEEVSISDTILRGYLKGYSFLFCNPHFKNNKEDPDIPNCYKEIHPVLLKAKSKDFRINTTELINARWLPYKETREQLTYTNAMAILDNAHNYLLDLKRNKPLFDGRFE
jgi:hypothetical protein